LVDSTKKLNQNASVSNGTVIKIELTSLFECNSTHIPS